MEMPETYQKAIEKLKEKKLLISMYEESYNRSRETRPEKNLPSLDKVKAPFLETKDRDGYIAKLDELAHMKSSIDAAYNYVKRDDTSSYYSIPLLINCMKAVHDDWCLNNKEKFSDPGRTDRQWQFLSASSIGWSEFKKDRKYADIVLEKMGLTTPETKEFPDNSDVTKKRIPDKDLQEYYEKYVYLPGTDKVKTEKEAVRLAKMEIVSSAKVEYSPFFETVKDSFTEKVSAIIDQANEAQNKAKVAELKKEYDKLNEIF